MLKLYFILVIAVTSFSRGQSTFGRTSEASHACDVTVKRSLVTDRDTRILVDSYSARHVKRRGTILALHSAAGALTSPTVDFDDIGQFTFACQGFVVILPHYLEATGIRSVTNVSVAERLRAQWTRQVAKVAEQIFGNRGPDYLLGDSLGGFLALVLAPKFPHLKALVLTAVGIDNLRLEDLPRNRKILIQAGLLDTIVKASSTESLVQMLEESQCEVTLAVYKQAGHEVLMEERRQVLARELEFLQ